MPLAAHARRVARGGHGLGTGHHPVVQQLDAPAALAGIEAGQERRRRRPRTVHGPLGTPRQRQFAVLHLF